jgi:hypothetical protein
MLFMTVAQFLKYLSKNNAIRMYSNLDLDIFKCNNGHNITYPTRHVKTVEDPDFVGVF